MDWSRKFMTVTGEDRGGVVRDAGDRAKIAVRIKLRQGT
jgi:predicted amino acid-binding ACT domain protein